MSVLQANRPINRPAASRQNLENAVLVIIAAVAFFITTAWAYQQTALRGMLVINLISLVVGIAGLYALVVVLSHRRLPVASATDQNGDKS